MNKDIQPAITPLNLEYMIKQLKIVGACREDTTNWRGELGMRCRKVAILTGLLATLTLAGCASSPQQ